MNVAELANALENKNLHLAASILKTLLPNAEEPTAQVFMELFNDPRITSNELLVKLKLHKGELAEIYSGIKNTQWIKDLFDLSPYPYLVKTIGNLASEPKRTAQLIRKEFPTPPVKTMELFISDRCNARCRFCYNEGQMYPPGKRVLSTSEFVHIVDDFANLGGENLDLCGGLEPLLSPAAPDLLKAGIDRGLKVSLYTNGISLNQPQLIPHLLQLNRIRVSLNASDRDSYKHITRVNQFDTVTRNIRELVAAKQSVETKLLIGINFVVFKDNYHQIPPMIRLAQSLGVDFLDLRTVHVTDMGQFTESEHHELKSILAQIKMEIQSGKLGLLHVSIADTFQLIDPCNNFMQGLKSNFIHQLVHFRVTVTPHGDVYALNVKAQPTREDDRYMLGNLDIHTSLVDVLKKAKPIPFEPEFLLPHDMSLLAALDKFDADWQAGFQPEDHPFTFFPFS